MSTERIIVVDAVADIFVAKFAAKATSLIAGDPREGRTPLGAVVDRRTIETAKTLLDDALAKGAKCVAGGESSGVIMSACAVDHVTPEMKLYSEESFGPIVAVFRAKDEVDAVRIANDTEFGLSVAVFSRDITRALIIANESSRGCAISMAHSS